MQTRWSDLDDEQTRLAQIAHDVVESVVVPHVAATRDQEWPLLSHVVVAEELARGEASLIDIRPSPRASAD